MITLKMIYKKHILHYSSIQLFYKKKPFLIMHKTELLWNFCQELNYKNTLAWLSGVHYLFVLFGRLVNPWCTQLKPCYYALSVCSVIYPKSRFCIKPLIIPSHKGQRVPTTAHGFQFCMYKYYWNDICSETLRTCCQNTSFASILFMLNGRIQLILPG